MQVIHNGTGKIYRVYDITYTTCGDPIFLIYDNGWQRIRAEHFVPTAAIETENFALSDGNYISDTIHSAFH